MSLAVPTSNTAAPASQLERLHESFIRLGNQIEILTKSVSYHADRVVGVRVPDASSPETPQPVSYCLWDACAELERKIMDLTAQINRFQD